MKSRNDPGLKITAEIDQQIAARNQVNARKRRITNDAVGRKNAKVPDFLGDRVAALLLAEESVKAPLRDALQQGVRIGAVSCDGERPLVDIGGEDLQLRG